MNYEDLTDAYMEDPAGTAAYVAQQAAAQEAQRIAAYQAQLSTQQHDSATAETASNFAAAYLDDRMHSTIKEWPELREGVAAYIAANPHAFPDEGLRDPHVGIQAMIDIAKVVDHDKRVVRADAQWEAVKDAGVRAYWQTPAGREVLDEIQRENPGA